VALQGEMGNERCTSDSVGIKRAHTMREQLQARLNVLKAELAAGKVKLRELEFQQLRLREVLLRLRGGIQILEELLGHAKSEGPAQQAQETGQESPTPEPEPGTPAEPDPAGRPGTEGGGPP
jgi:hypothetical protein